MRNYFTIILLSLIVLSNIEFGSAEEIKNNFPNLNNFISDAFNSLIVDFLNAIANSAFTDFDNDLCVNQTLAVIEGLQKGLSEIWAYKMIDAWGKVPSGILRGNSYEFGSFEECIYLQKDLGKDLGLLKGQYCLAKITINGSNIELPFTLPSQHEIHIGICVPATCNGSLLQNLLEKALNITNETISIQSETCTTNAPVVFNGLDWFAIIVFSIFGLILILSTVYDFAIERENAKPIFLVFSMRTNCEKIFQMQSQTSPEIIECVNGIRCLSIVWVIYGHTYENAFRSPLTNQLYMWDWIQNYYSSLLLNSSVAVDSFLLLSGFLVGYVILKELNRTNGKLNIPLMYFHRFLRLTPVLAATLLFAVTLMKHLGSGPLWNSGAIAVNTKSCEDYWWATILYIQNYVNQNKPCLAHTWYLGVDTQLYLISPFILIPLWRWGKKFLWVIPTLMVLSMSYTFAIFIVHDLNIKISEKLLDDLDVRDLTYMPTHTRFGPWMIGVLLAYFLHINKDREIRFPKLYVILGWTISLSVILLVLFGPYKARLPDSNTTTLESAFYEALSRNAWSLALAWIILACTVGYGGLINSLLSLPFWQPFSRLTYSMYIIHMPIQLIVSQNMKISRHFSDLEAIMSFWGYFGLTLCVSILSTLTFESPILQLEKIIFSSKYRPKSPNSSQEPIGEHAELSAQREINKNA